MKSIGKKVSKSKQVQKKHLENFEWFCITIAQ